jgi:hypothetical protein
MNPEAIRKTAVTRYDTRENVYIVESPLLEICRGAADTEAEAIDIFEDGLQAMYINYLEGKQVARYKRGRPPKGAVSMHIQVKPDSRSSIDNLKQEFECSQGEVVDYLVHFHYCKSSMASKTTGAQKKVRRV